MYKPRTGDGGEVARAICEGCLGSSYEESATCSSSRKWFVAGFGSFSRDRKFPGTSANGGLRDRGYAARMNGRREGVISSGEDFG